MELVKVGETVKINGQTYKVISADDCSQFPHLKAENDRYGIAQMVGIQKPNGRRVWVGNQYQDGSFGQMTKI